MLGYVTLGTNDMARATQFYDALLEPYGVKHLIEGEKMILWGTSNGAAGTCTKPSYNGPYARRPLPPPSRNASPATRCAIPSRRTC